MFLIASSMQVIIAKMRKQENTSEVGGSKISTTGLQPNALKFVSEQKIFKQKVLLECQLEDLNEKRIRFCCSCKISKNS